MILKEFAIDPSLLATWDRCRYITDMFDAQYGRVIAKYPAQDWLSSAYTAAKSAGNSQMELKKIEERLSQLRKKRTALFARGRPANKATKWIESACIEHARCPFNAVVCEPSGIPQTVCYDDLNPAMEPMQSVEDSVPRQSVSMANSIEIMFASGQHYKLIDKYFSKRVSESFLNPIREFLSRIDSREKGAHDVTFEIITASEGNSFNDQIFESNVRKQMEGHIPEEIKLVITFHPEDQLHDRWIINEWVGVRFGQGFDEGSNPEHVNISVITEQRRVKIWNGDYDSPS
ncbi:MAG: hypothetical protein RKH07_01950 [Gammaproteobacteria bacterium]